MSIASQLTLIDQQLHSGITVLSGAITLKGGTVLDNTLGGIVTAMDTISQEVIPVPVVEYPYSAASATLTKLILPTAAEAYQSGTSLGQFSSSASIIASDLDPEVFTKKMIYDEYATFTSAGTSYTEFRFPALTTPAGDMINVSSFGASKISFISSGGEVLTSLDAQYNTSAPTTTYPVRWTQDIASSGYCVAKVNNTTLTGLNLEAGYAAKLNLPLRPDYVPRAMMIYGSFYYEPTDTVIYISANYPQIYTYYRTQTDWQTIPLPDSSVIPSVRVNMTDFHFDNGYLLYCVSDATTEKSRKYKQVLLHLTTVNNIPTWEITASVLSSLNLSTSATNITHWIYNASINVIITTFINPPMMQGDIGSTTFKAYKATDQTAYTLSATTFTDGTMMDAFYSIPGTSLILALLATSSTTWTNFKVALITPSVSGTTVTLTQNGISNVLANTGDITAVSVISSWNIGAMYYCLFTFNSSNYVAVINVESNTLVGVSAYTGSANVLGYSELVTVDSESGTELIVAMQPSIGKQYMLVLSKFTPSVSSYAIKYRLTIHKLDTDVTLPVVHQTLWFTVGATNRTSLTEYCGFSASGKNGTYLISAENGAKSFGIYGLK